MLGHGWTRQPTLHGFGGIWWYKMIHFHWYRHVKLYNCLFLKYIYIYFYIYIYLYLYIFIFIYIYIYLWTALSNQLIFPWYPNLFCSDKPIFSKTGAMLFFSSTLLWFPSEMSTFNKVFQHARRLSKWRGRWTESISVFFQLCIYTYY